MSNIEIFELVISIFIISPIINYTLLYIIFVNFGFKQEYKEKHFKIEIYIRDFIKWINDDFIQDWSLAIIFPIASSIFLVFILLFLILEIIALIYQWVLDIKI